MLSILYMRFSVAVRLFRVHVISMAFIMLDIFGTAAPFSFSWVGPNNFSSTNQDIFNLDAGNYTVTVTDTNGNSTTQTYIIYVTKGKTVLALIHFI